jgi:4-amino-4-deoxy-L-arabinose transferase-like glycosyltransferase
VELSTDTQPSGRATVGSPPAPAPPPPPRHPRLRRLAAPLAWLAEHPAVVVLLLAAGAAVWAIAGSHRAFRYLSDDHDEGLYLLQARALADGHLFPPAPEHGDAFLPWLSVLSDGKYVLKYAPVHGSFLALGIRLLGSPRWSLGLVAAAAVVVTYALAKEVLRDRAFAALAAGFLALSPLFLIQSATFLPYCSNVLLLAGFAFTLLRGLRTNSWRFIAASGFVFGVAAFARPYDALLFGLPLGVYAIVASRRDGRLLLRRAGWFTAGLALPVAAMLLYYRAATGSPFRPPFNLLEPGDTIGFGPRRLLPGHPGLTFTPELGSRGVARHVVLTSFWGFGGLLLVGCFVLGLLRRRAAAGPQASLVLAGAVFAFGYGLFWGTWGTSLRGSLTSFLGPFYFLPVLLCVCVLAAAGFGELWRRDRFMGVVAMVAMVAVSGYLLVEALRINLGLTAEDRRLYAPVVAADLDRAIVLLQPMWGPHLLHPFAWLQNDADYDGNTVYALDRGETANLALLEDFPGREIYRLRVHGHYRTQPPDPGLTTSLEPLAVHEQPSLVADVTVRNPTDDAYISLSVTVSGRQETFILDRGSQGGAEYRGTLTIDPAAVTFDGPSQAQVSEAVEDNGLLTVELHSWPGDASGATRVLYRRQFGYEVHGAGVRVLLPGITPVNELGAEPLGVRSDS